MTKLDARKSSSSFLAAAGTVLLLATGCPPSPADQLSALTLPPQPDTPDGSLEITDANADAHLYAFYVAEPGSARRADEREALILHVLHDAQGSLTDTDALDVRDVLRRALRLFDPAEMEAGLDSAALRKLLAWIEPVVRRLGLPEDSLIVAEARLLSDPNDEQAAATVREIGEWVGTGEEEAEALERRAQLYDAVTDVLPSPGLVKKLVGLIFERHDLGLQPTRMESLEDWLRNAQRDQYFFSGLTLNILRLAARMGRPEATAEMLDPYRGTPAYLVEVLEEIEGLNDPLRRADASSDLIDAIGMQFGQEIRQTCTILRREFPQDGRFSACLGRYFYATGETGIAARMMLEATVRDPESRDFSELAMMLLGEVLRQGMDGLSWDALERLHEAFRILSDRHRTAWPLADPPVDETAVLRLMANAALIAGDVTVARSYHQQALELEPTADSYFQFGQMEARGGDPQRALELLRAGLAVTTGDLADRTLAQANIREELGLLLKAEGDDDGARTSFDEAIDDWKQLGRAGVVAGAEMDGRIDVLLVRNGQHDDGMQRIARAVRQAGEDDFGPVQDQLVYNDTLSFLHMEGERELLVELFPLVATRGDLDVTWRVYYALWTLGALRWAGLPDDDEAVAFLRAIRASGWSAVLVRFYLGELTFDDALAEAGTLGQETELRYYEALNRFASGDRDGARQLLRQVVDTHIFNYYEWQMADRLLASLDAGR